MKAKHIIGALICVALLLGAGIWSCLQPTQVPEQGGNTDAATSQQKTDEGSETMDQSHEQSEKSPVDDQVLAFLPLPEDIATEPLSEACELPMLELPNEVEIPALTAWALVEGEPEDLSALAESAAKTLFGSYTTEEHSNRIVYSKIENTSDGDFERAIYAREDSIRYHAKWLDTEETPYLDDPAVDEETAIAMAHDFACSFGLASFVSNVPSEIKYSDSAYRLTWDRNIEGLALPNCNLVIRIIGESVVSLEFDCSNYQAVVEEAPAYFISAEEAMYCVNYARTLASKEASRFYSAPKLQRVRLVWTNYFSETYTSVDYTPAYAFRFVEGENFYTIFVDPYTGEIMESGEAGGYPSPYHMGTTTPKHWATTANVPDGDELGSIAASNGSLYYEVCTPAQNSEYYRSVTIHELSFDSMTVTPITEINSLEKAFYTNELTCVGDRLFWAYQDSDETRIEQYFVESEEQSTLIAYPTSKHALALCGDARFLTWYLQEDDASSLYCYDCVKDEIFCVSSQIVIGSGNNRAYVNDGLTAFLAQSEAGKSLVVYDLEERCIEYTCILPGSFQPTRLQANANYVICTSKDSDNDLYVLDQTSGRFEKIGFGDTDCYIFSCHLYEDHVWINDTLSNEIVILSLSDHSVPSIPLGNQVFQASISADGFYYAYSNEAEEIHVWRLG